MLLFCWLLNCTVEDAAWLFEDVVSDIRMMTTPDNLFLGYIPFVCVAICHAQRPSRSFLIVGPKLQRGSRKNYRGKLISVSMETGVICLNPSVWPGAQWSVSRHNSSPREPGGNMPDQANANLLAGAGSNPFSKLDTCAQQRWMGERRLNNQTQTTIEGYPRLSPPPTHTHSPPQHIWKPTWIPEIGLKVSSVGKLSV